ncbi:hypothetical protein DFJ63DRAFT_109212 [Scheffersomyces coipomensis]|uniref:uncharacterized protein n=1 Tax=Scheffersomyces coipomensis TaxID=1788519 RepID=UPI00315C4E60
MASSVFPPDDIQLIVSKIATILRARNETLSISEAACGGLISAYIVSIPGASNFYIGGKLVYSLKQRLKLSGWTDEEIRNYMGPSKQVALKLARTTKYELGSTYVLSETGFAGPSQDLHLIDEDESNGGKSDEKNEQVGTVYIGFSGPNTEVSQSSQTGSHDRSENMTKFAKIGLQFLLEQLEKINDS